MVAGVLSTSGGNSVQWDANDCDASEPMEYLASSTKMANGVADVVSIMLYLIYARRPRLTGNRHCLTGQ